MTISSAELKKLYLAFFEKKGHRVIPSASLIPENDPSVLFTTAGMHPLVPFLLGEPHPLGKRLTNVQKCVRTNDIDEVGDSWHLSFFEMLGNWSLGDYFKEEAISMSFEFLTKELKVPAERFSVTCFAGDKDAPRDEETARIWERLGVAKNRIHFLPKKDNWWGPAGQTGPCGPDTEMFYHTKDIQEKSTGEFLELSNSGPFSEVWNDVLMQYNKTADGSFEELRQKNVDTGMGVERMVAALNGADNAYECDTLAPILGRVISMSAPGTAKTNRSARIITDHIRAAVMILGDEKGVVPSNVDQGYVLRRFIRRSIRHARLIGIKGEFCSELARIAIDVMGDSYPEVRKNSQRIFEELKKEENKFLIALENGTKQLERELLLLEGSRQKVLNAKSAFDLFQSFGFPLEITAEMCKEKGFDVDVAGFDALMREHQEISRKGAEQKFKGGLADHSEATTKLHTATHLLNQALREVVDRSIHQLGSNITQERLRFDFNWDKKLTDDQIKRIEDWVNGVIKAEADVSFEIMPLDEAKRLGAQGVFEERYEQNVKVYTIAKGKTVYSREICGGPHVRNTRELGTFKIIKQEAVAAGVRRIKAIVE
ncbi:MAG: alanine--tRNA ligase [Candidatus Micrarchaeales archaeon]|nr:alanine--tRNA ligase [Candidatus Micrarchaeales archaeon]